MVGKQRKNDGRNVKIQLRFPAMSGSISIFFIVQAAFDPIHPAFFDKIPANVLQD